MLASILDRLKKKLDKFVKNQAIIHVISLFTNQKHLFQASEYWMLRTNNGLAVTLIPPTCICLVTLSGPLQL